MSDGLQRVTHVIFDLGGVVLRWQPDALIAAAYADLELRSAVKREMFAHADWLDMDRGVLTQAAAAVRFAARLQRPLAEIGALVEQAMHSLQPMPETVALLERLERAGVPLYCLSNMPIEFAAHLRGRYDFFRVFRGVVMSGEVGLIKPDPRIFALIADRFGLAPASTVFVDDISANVESAAALGFHTIRFEHAADCAARLDVLLRAC